MPANARIAPCLWFDQQAEEAAKFYVSVFRNSKINTVTRYPAAGREIHHREPGTVLTVDFELDGQPVTALNGGPEFPFTEAISLQIFCDTQQEIDQYWDKLSEGGDPKSQQCGWLKDKFGLSWQVAPRRMPEMLKDHASEQAARVMTALLGMKKLDLGALERAYAGETTPAAAR